MNEADYWLMRDMDAIMQLSVAAVKYGKKERAMGVLWHLDKKVADVLQRGV